MFRIVPAMERQTMDFGVEFWTREQISGSDCHCQSKTSVATVKAFVRLDFFSYRYVLCLQRAVGSGRIVYALV
jgi:hypothetical protein